MIDPIQTLLFMLAVSVMAILGAAAGGVALVIGYGLWQMWQHIRRWS